MTAPANFTPMPLVEGTVLPNVSATIYTAPPGATDQGVIVAGLHVVNYTAAPATLSVWVVASGAAEADQYRVIAALSIPADGAEYTFLKGVMLAKGDFIRWLAGTATALSGRIDGVKMET